MSISDDEVEAACLAPIDGGKAFHWFVGGELEVTDMHRMVMRAALIAAAKVRAIREGDGDSLRKMHPISDEGLRGIAGKQFGINDPDLCAELAAELLALRAAKEGN